MQGWKQTHGSFLNNSHHNLRKYTHTYGGPGEGLARYRRASCVCIIMDPSIRKEIDPLVFISSPLALPRCWGPLSSKSTSSTDRFVSLLRHLEFLQEMWKQRRNTSCRSWVLFCLLGNNAEGKWNHLCSRHPSDPPVLGCPLSCGHPLSLKPPSCVPDASSQREPARAGWKHHRSRDPWSRRAVGRSGGLVGEKPGQQGWWGFLGSLRQQHGQHVQKNLPF